MSTTNTTLPPEPKTSADRWFDRMFLLAILVVSGFAFSLLVAEPDLWGHVQYGRDALREGLHRTTTYSFTANGHRWINHENLSELLFATVYDHAGISALLAGKCLLGLYIVGLMLWRAHRSSVSPIVAAATVLILSINLTGFWYVRPQVLSYTLFATLIALLTFAFEGWDSRWHLPFLKRLVRDDQQESKLDRNRLTCVAAAAVLFVVWVNTHGAFLAGLCIFLAYVSIRAVELLLSGKAANRQTSMRLLLIAGFVAAATLINPYGYKLHAWLLESLTIPRPEIVEWHPLRMSDQPFVPFTLLCSLVAIGLWFSRRSLDATQLAILGLTFWQAASHQRHIPFFVLLCGFWMPVHWQSAFNRYVEWKQKRLGEEQHSQQLSERAKIGSTIGLGLVSLVIALVLVTRWEELPVPRDAYPVSAIEFMADEKINGRLVVTYNWAQYAIASLGVPSEHNRNDESSDGHRLTKVSFDGRFRTCYPLSTIDQHFDFVLGNHPNMRRYRDANSPAPDSAAILQLDQPDLVLISRKQPHSVNTMESNRHDWTLLYQDQLAQLWGRQKKYDSLQSRDYFPPDRRNITNEPQTGAKPWPALPHQDPS